jgi:two-component system OmpR family sensor kinase
VTRTPTATSATSAAPAAATVTEPAGAEPPGPRPVPPRSARTMRGWLHRPPLRTQLIAGLLVLLVAACAAVAIGTTFALRGFLVDRLDEQLAAAGGRFSGTLGDHDGDHPAREFGDAPGQAIGTLSGRLAAGTITQAAITTEGGAKPLALPAEDLARLGAVPTTGRPVTVHLDATGDYRVQAVKGGDGDSALSGLPFQPVNDTLRRLVSIELIVFALALSATGVAGAVFVRLSLRPLRRVASTALQVAALPLASGEVVLPDRVPGAEPYTEVGQVGEAFNHMLEHIEASLTARHETEDRLRQFVADASHELRTPLAAIRSHAELARRNPDPVPAAVAHALGRVESEAERMGSLVDDLLLLARLDAGRPLAREPVDLTRLAIDATSDTRAAGADHRFLLDLPDEPVEVTGDPHRLHQVLANLLTNALTHTPPGTTVTVHVAAVDGGAAGSGVAEVTVSDDGPGIPAQLQPRIFQRFVRADSARSRAAGSTGLGLAIAAAVVEAHHGTLGLTSRPGATSFTLRLPRAAG